MAEAATAETGQTTPPPTTTTPAPTAGEQAGQGLLDWRSMLPQDLRSHSVIQQFPTTDAAARTLIAQQEMIGRGLYLPKDDADAQTKTEAMNKVYDRLGRPKDAASYAVPEVKLPNEATFEAEFLRKTQEYAYQHGLSQEQYEGLLALSGEVMHDGHNLMESRKAQSKTESLAALGRKFGASAGRLQQEAIGFWEQFGAGAFGGEEGRTAAQAFAEATLPDGSLLQYHPAIVNSFSQAYKQLGEGEFFDSQFFQPGVNTADTLKTRMDALTAKRHGEGLTPGEEQERQRIAQNMLQMRERDAARGTGRAA